MIPSRESIATRPTLQSNRAFRSLQSLIAILALRFENLVISWVYAMFLRWISVNSEENQRENSTMNRRDFSLDNSGFSCLKTTSKSRRLSIISLDRSQCRNRIGLMISEMWFPIIIIHQVSLLLLFRNSDCSLDSRKARIQMSSKQCGFALCPQSARLRFKRLTR